ncbi:hypothetical protein TRVL_08187 [Trypanosoma vivax]|nr:hypothetical protein TRVL_08187 [Trypanosoma vivax]
MQRVFDKFVMQSKPLLDGLLDFAQISTRAQNCEVVRKEPMLHLRDAVEPLAQRIHLDDERQRSQHRALRDTAGEADILRQRVVHPRLRSCRKSAIHDTKFLPTPKDGSSLTMQP